jgi:hypothetical protein
VEVLRRDWGLRARVAPTHAADAVPSLA